MIRGAKMTSLDKLANIIGKKALIKNDTTCNYLRIHKVSIIDGEVICMVSILSEKSGKTYKINYKNIKVL